MPYSIINNSILNTNKANPVKAAKAVKTVKTAKAVRAVRIVSIGQAVANQAVRIAKQIAKRAAIAANKIRLEKLHLGFSSRSQETTCPAGGFFRCGISHPSFRLLAVPLFLLFSAIHSANAADIALIIDDIGNKPEDIDAFSLPSEVTFSILPHTPYSTSFSQLAEQQQREVMLHIPMESLSGKALGPGALTSGMLPSDIKTHLAAAHQSVPNAIAINNHMGSKLTQLTLPMTATMEYLHDKGLYFVDSRTTRYSRAERIATKVGVPNLHRHVFLDHLPEPKHISMQFKRLRSIANKYGRAVGIAHPYPQTLRYLKANLPELRKQGFRLVTLSEVMLGDEGQVAMQAYKAISRPAAIQQLPKSLGKDPAPEK